MWRFYHLALHNERAFLVRHKSFTSLVDVSNLPEGVFFCPALYYLIHEWLLTTFWCTPERFWRLVHSCYSTQPISCFMFTSLTAHSVVIGWFARTDFDSNKATGLSVDWFRLCKPFSSFNYALTAIILVKQKLSQQNRNVMALHSQHLYTSSTLVIRSGVGRHRNFPQHIPT